MRDSELTQWYIAIGLELAGSFCLMIAVATQAPWNATLWAPASYLVYLAFAYRRWMRL
jgi:hypothetical protein